MNPVVVDIKKDWDYVGSGIKEIHDQFHWLEYRPEDVYAACVNGTAVLYRTEEGFAIFTIEVHPITQEKSFLCWLAWGADKGLGLVSKHFDFFCQEGKRLGCTRFKAKTPINGLDKMFTEIGFRCDMRDFSFDLAGSPAVGE